MPFRPTLFYSLALLFCTVLPSGSFHTPRFSVAPESALFQRPADAGPAMVLIKGGSFLMGDNFSEGFSDEQPVHRITVSDFYMSVSEISFDEYDEFCTASGRKTASDNDWGRGKHPVINVDWYDAIEYCNWLSKKEKRRPVYIVDQEVKDPQNGQKADHKKWIVSPDWTADGYRLPTEAEWEYAARERGRPLRYGTGSDSLLPQEANFCASQYKTSSPKSVMYRQKTVHIDELKTNKSGLRHMAGNVWEWCWDWYGTDTYQLNAEARNPTGAESGSGRVLRGGSWYNLPAQCRASFRMVKAPHSKTDNAGFRVVRR